MKEINRFAHWLNLLLLCTPICLFAQSAHKTDSLINILQQQDLPEIEEAKIQRYIAYYHPNLMEGRNYALRSVALFQKVGEPVLMAEALEELSHTERRLGNNTASFEASFKALRIYEEKGLKERLAASYNQLASNYVSDEDYKVAIGYFNKALDIYKNSDDLVNHASTLINLGETYRLNGDLNDAEIHLQQTLQLNKELKNDIIEGYAIGNLGMVKSALGEFEIAKDYLENAANSLESLGDPYSASFYWAALAKIMENQGNMTQAELHYHKAMSLANTHDLKEQIRDYSQQLSSFYEKHRNYDEALRYQKLHQVYKDSILNKSNIQKIEQLKAGYEIDKRESEIGLLNSINTNQRYFLWALMAGILIAILFSYLLYRVNRKIKTANQTLTEQKVIIGKREQEKALLLKELNHRVKNNLQMISSLLSLQSSELEGHSAQDAILAGKHRVEALSLVHRKLYQEGAETKIDAKEYMEDLIGNLFHGFGVSFRPNTEIGDFDMKINQAIPLALIVNELVINALKYAYNDRPDPKLWISMHRPSNESIHLEVKDNGSGFEDSSTNDEGGFGIKLVHSLVAQLQGTLQKVPSEGTHWVLNFNLP